MARVESTALLRRYGGVVSGCEGEEKRQGEEELIRDQQTGDRLIHHEDGSCSSRAFTRAALLPPPRTDSAWSPPGSRGVAARSCDRLAAVPETSSSRSQPTTVEVRRYASPDGVDRGVPRESKKSGKNLVTNLCQRSGLDVGDPSAKQKTNHQPPDEETHTMNHPITRLFTSSLSPSPCSARQTPSSRAWRRRSSCSNRPNLAKSGPAAGKGPGTPPERHRQQGGLRSAPSRPSSRRSKRCRRRKRPGPDQPGHHPGPGRHRRPLIRVNSGDRSSLRPPNPDKARSGAAGHAAPPR